ncbi:MAG TPA: hypothetical protein VGY13_14745 [Solirubrobacteraceae bacterium]|jgi:hypothetical protein|nr:hypothetical protein [Solirubrobacteraceae bacterium]
MGAEAESGAIAGLATEAVAPIEGELRERLEAELGERDLVAVESALLKAFLGGMQAANAETAETVIDQQGAVLGMTGGLVNTPAGLDLALPHLDPWAERFGA